MTQLLNLHVLLVLQRDLVRSISKYLVLVGCLYAFPTAWNRSAIAGAPAAILWRLKATAYVRTRNLTANSFMGHYAILPLHLALHKLWYVCKKFDQHLVFEALSVLIFHHK